MKNNRWTILAALLLAATSVAQAQEVPPGEAGAPGAAATTATADSGAVTNTQTTTTTSSTGIGPDGVSVDVDPTLSEGSETTELANTGGEPVLMSLMGLSLALGAFAIRKRVSA